jgi:hypothetical protein
VGISLDVKTSQRIFTDNNLPRDEWVTHHTCIKYLSIYLQLTQIQIHTPR